MWATKPKSEKSIPIPIPNLRFPSGIVTMGSIETTMFGSRTVSISSLSSNAVNIRTDIEKW